MERKMEFLVRPRLILGIFVAEAGGVKKKINPSNI
jgi:hypothetical protein